MPQIPATRTPIDNLPFTRRTGPSSRGIESAGSQTTRPRSRWDSGDTNNPFSTPLSTPLHTPEPDGAPSSFQHFLESDPNAGSRQSLPLLDNVDYETSGGGGANGAYARVGGDAHRVVNSGFEVLPLGTHGVPELAATSDRRSTRKLHKKNASYASRDSNFVEQI